MMAGEGGQRAAAAIRRLYPRGQRNCGFLRRHSALFGFRLFCRSAALPRRAGGLALEARTAATREPLWRARLRVLKESFFQWVANRYDLTIGPLNAKRYRTELSLNADYRRFDDTLRLVVDSTEAQAADITAFLDEQHAAGRCAYGVHQSDEALMTCLVFSLEASDHLHFIDGADGGFALAARQLKSQLAAARS
jgi:hypothetical protein